MRDIDYADALCAEIPDDSIEQMDFVLGERRRRFVHYQNARSGSERARDFDQLLLRHRELAHFRIGVNLGPDTLEKLARAVSPFGPAYAARCRRGLQTQCHILGHRQIRKERRLLVDGRDSHRSRGSGIQPRNGFPIDLDVSPIGLMRSSDDFYERGFPRAILAEQRVHFAPVEIKRDAP